MFLVLLSAWNDFTYVAVKESIKHGNTFNHTIILSFSLFIPVSLSTKKQDMPPTSQSLYYQSHLPSVLTRHQPVTASVPTSERFSSDYENISSLSPGPHTVNPLMYRCERNPPENSSHFRYSMYGDHGVSSLPYTSSTQHETLSCDPVQRKKQATSVWTYTLQMFCIAEWAGVVVEMVVSIIVSTVLSLIYPLSGYVNFCIIPSSCR